MQPLLSQITQRGSALIMALLIVAIVALLSTVLLIHQQLDIRRSSQLFNYERAYLAAQTMQARAITLLKADLQAQQISTWPKQLTKLQIPGGEVTAILWDAQGRYNLNNLRDKANQANFIQLIATVAPDMDTTAVHELAATITEWVSNNANQRTETADYYVQHQPPYRAAHQIMLSISELSLVKGMTAKLYQQLEPFVIALPQNTMVNLNSASAPVLVSAMPNLDLNIAQALVDQREAQGAYMKMSDLTGSELIRGQNINITKLCLTSDFYLLQINVQLAKQHIMLYSLLQRGINNNKPYVNVLWQMQSL